MKILKRYIGLIFYFLFFLVICIAVDYFKNKIVFDNLEHYYIILSGALAYHFYTYFYATQVKIDNDLILVSYIPSFNRNKSIAIREIEEIRIMNSYLYTNFTIYLGSFKKVKFSSMNQSNKKDRELKKYFEESKEFKTHKNLMKWKARKV